MSAEMQGAETYEPRELPPEIEAAWLAYGLAVNRVHRVAWNDVRGFVEALGDAPHRLREAIADHLAAVERERDEWQEAASGFEAAWREVSASLAVLQRERDEARRALDWMQLVMTPNNWGGDGPHEVYLAGLRNGPADAEAFQVELRSAGGKIQWSVNGATLLDAIKAAMDEDARREAFAE